MPWSAVGNEALWVKAYRHVHDVMRSVSHLRVRLERRSGLPATRDGGLSRRQLRRHHRLRRLRPDGRHSLEPVDEKLGRSSGRVEFVPTETAMAAGLRGRARKAGQLSRVGPVGYQRQSHRECRRRRPHLHPGHVRLDEQSSRVRAGQPRVQLLFQRRRRLPTPDQRARLPERVGALQNTLRVDPNALTDDERGSADRNLDPEGVAPRTVHFARPAASRRPARGGVVGRAARDLGQRRQGRRTQVDSRGTTDRFFEAHRDGDQLGPRSCGRHRGRRASASSTRST